MPNKSRKTEISESVKKTEFIENTEDDFHVSNPNPLKKLSQKEKEEAQVSARQAGDDILETALVVFAATLEVVAEAESFP